MLIIDMDVTKQHFWLITFIKSIIFLCCFSEFAHAQIGERANNRINGSLFVRSILVDNGDGADGISEQTSETQTEYGGTIAGGWVSELTSLALNYQLTETLFGENTQPDDSLLSGSSSFSLGNAATFYGLSAEHSIRRVLRNPGTSPILISNTDDREIYTLSPLLRTSIFDAFSAEFAFNFSRVDFSSSNDNDSEVKGADLRLIRYVSPIRELSFTLGQREIEYKVFEVANYETQFFEVRLQTEHRRFDYSIELGITKIDPLIGESVSEPTIDFALNSNIVGNRLSLFFNRLVSDSSQGNGNDSFFSSEVSFDSSLSQSDQIIRTSAGVGWSYELLCGRCDIGWSTGFEKSESVSIDENDTRQVFSDISFGYQFSSALSASVNVRASDTAFTSASSARPDTTSLVERLTFSYKMNRAFSLELQYERDERDSGNGVADTVVNSVSLLATLLIQ